MSQPELSALSMNKIKLILKSLKNDEMPGENINQCITTKKLPKKNFYKLFIVLSCVYDRVKKYKII